MSRHAVEGRLVVATLDLTTSDDEGQGSETGQALPTALIEVREWCSGQSLLDFDRRIHVAEDQARLDGHHRMRLQIASHAPDSPEAVAEARAQILMRYQRLFRRENDPAHSEALRRTLSHFVKLHDLDKPLVRADFDHALDVRQWVLALNPRASCALQIAALFHDVERLWSEPDRRVEQYAGDYMAFKRAHARSGARFLRRTLTELGLQSDVVERAGSLVREHEERGEDPELICLNDADALSFLILNSEGYLAYFGREQTRKKVEYTLARMSAEARAYVKRARLPEFIRSLVESEHTQA